MARLMLMYPIAYIFVWTLPTAIRIYQASKGAAAPFALQTIDKVNKSIAIEEPSSTEGELPSNFFQVMYCGPRLRRRPYLWCDRAYVVSLAQFTISQADAYYRRYNSDTCHDNGASACYGVAVKRWRVHYRFEDNNHC